MTEKCRIKKTVTDENGTELVKINVSYPCLKEEASEKNGFASRFDRYYQKISGAFLHYAETALKAKAAATGKGPPKKPFSCVMTYIVSIEDEYHISIALDAYSYAGAEIKTKRLCQNWDVKSGTLCFFNDVFPAVSKAELLNALYADGEKRMEKRVSAYYSDYKKRIKKYLKKDNFFISPKSYGFVFEAGALDEKNMPAVLTVSKDFFHREKS